MLSVTGAVTLNEASDWSAPLNVMVTVTVLDDIEQYVRA